MIINLIASGGGASVLTGDATTGDVLINKTFYSNDPASKLTGTMPDRSGDTACVSSSVDGTTLKLLASEGYRDGVNDTVSLTDADFVAGNIKNGVNVFGLAGNYTGLDTSDATAVAGDLLYNKTAYVNGSKITGLGATLQEARTLGWGTYAINLGYYYLPRLTLTGYLLRYSTETSVECYFEDITSLDNFTRYNNTVQTLLIRGDISKVTVFTNWVTSSALTTIELPQSQVKANMSLGLSSLLDSASLINVANSLDAASAPKTLTMHATSKTAMNNLMVDNNAGVAVPGTAMSLTAFITTVKGWTIA